MIYTYIAGYAPLSLFGADARPAWTSIAKGLKSNDLLLGPAGRPTVKWRRGRETRAELGEVGRPAPNFVAALRSANPAGKIQPATIDNPGKDPCRKQDQD